jgi:DNA-binding TFAR19-related protein (PDSD5 family)
MPNPKRKTMRGMGADAFFALDQQDVETVEQDASKPVNQQTSVPVQQQASETASQEDDKTVFMKATYYITPEQDLKLDRVRLARKTLGEKIDKSGLIRELIDMLVEQ